MANFSLVPYAASKGTAGTATAPLNGAAIATLSAANLPAGAYEVTVIAGYGGTPDVVNGMDFKAGTVVSQLAVLPATNTMQSRTYPRIDLDGATALTVNAHQAGAGGSVYIAEIIATRTA